MTLLFTPPTVSVPVTGIAERFPVHRVYCVGRNYVDHVREMREGDERDDPFFFQKPTDAVVPGDDQVPYPPRTSDFQFEGELVVAIGAEGVDVPVAQALDLVYGYAVGIDLTRRDRQRDCRDRQISWEAGKSFDASAPCGPITPRASVGDLAAAELRLDVNGEARQRTPLALMIWSVAEIISHLSTDYRLRPGDLIYTGTPAGVSAIVPGDVVHIEISGLEPLSITITEKGSHHDAK
ncbi:fumarylacetoacetate hydrolase family protein [Streptomyces sp. NBC_00825]|uniref:fumarylacetoacetate hydrolase family protein n=1 Tax=unclassified Streptomyces TaxID=2593676 RepID=UPI00225427DA|nr:MULTISPECIES: fumarylacetoacetate hydrolase family protein [unclassified Streptomyces]WTB58566.1 fumarylacetoacetate hydrolase family protein [Streptomyces sp. NBC_00826]WTH88556.1 fumarylacetoacetate hydrolase family protein [Streptomyces sp. NBC_00825]WTH97285.1 fumarylacetoacetate hydrolase family protein [Streptomyces sp. NBC_00822]MCX4862789.1 fumarylacetoacetate hydrolase family protein [Streptomyces sp. NBC_00906]MCX4894026.1 fumarylacetoacetate hydrolase family protein [Streptomyces